MCRRELEAPTIYPIADFVDLIGYGSAAIQVLMWELAVTVLMQYLSAAGLD